MSHMEGARPCQVCSTQSADVRTRCDPSPPIRVDNIDACIRVLTSFISLIKNTTGTKPTHKLVESVLIDVYFLRGRILQMTCKISRGQQWIHHPCKQLEVPMDRSPISREDASDAEIPIFMDCPVSTKSDSHRDSSTGLLLGAADELERTSTPHTYQ